MKIAGITKCSFADWPCRIAAVLFTPGCNLNCSYCHNRGLLSADAERKLLDPDAIVGWLETRKDCLEGVVLSGGEPTLQPDLPDFIVRLRALGYPVKLDTNGSQPAVLAKLLQRGLLDYVAMDVKAPRERYQEVCNAPVDVEAVSESIRLLRDSAVDYEFRTTVAPELTDADLKAIAFWIRGARRYVLQRHRWPVAGARLFDAPGGNPTRDASWVPNISEYLRPLVQSCEMRGFETRRSIAPAGSVSVPFGAWTAMQNSDGLLVRMRSSKQDPQHIRTAV